MDFKDLPLISKLFLVMAVLATCLLIIFASFVKNTESSEKISLIESYPPKAAFFLRTAQEAIRLSGSVAIEDIRIIPGFSIESFFVKGDKKMLAIAAENYLLAAQEIQFYRRGLARKFLARAIILSVGLDKRRYQSLYEDLFS